MLHRVNTKIPTCQQNLYDEKWLSTQNCGGKWYMYKLYMFIKSVNSRYWHQTWGNCNRNCNVIVMNYIFKVMESNL